MFIFDRSDRPRRATVLNYFGDGVYSDSNDPIIKQHTFDGRNLPAAILEAFAESDVKKVSQTLRFEFFAIYKLPIVAIKCFLQQQ